MFRFNKNLLIFRQILFRCSIIYYDFVQFTDFLESDKLCSLSLQSKVIEIGKDAKSAAVIEETSYFDTFTGRHPFKCQFKVKSIQEMGIFAVIQKMKLRKNKTTGDCIDYVQVHVGIFIGY